MKLFFVTTGGGLGNQIMSYALWLYLKKSGYRTVFYLRKNHLERIFYIGFAILFLISSPAKRSSAFKACASESIIIQSAPIFTLFPIVIFLNAQMTEALMPTDSPISNIAFSSVSGYRTVFYLRKNHLERIFDIKDSLIKKNYLDFFIYIIKLWGSCTRFFYRLFHKVKDVEYSSLLGINVIDYPEWGDYKFIDEILAELKKKLSFPEDNNENNRRIFNYSTRITRSYAISRY